MSILPPPGAFRPSSSTPITSLFSQFPAQQRSIRVCRGGGGWFWHHREPAAVLPWLTAQAGFDARMVGGRGTAEGSCMSLKLKSHKKGEVVGNAAAGSKGNFHEQQKEASRMQVVSPREAPNQTVPKSTAVPLTPQSSLLSGTPSIFPTLLPHRWHRRAARRSPVWVPHDHPKSTAPQPQLSSTRSLQQHPRVKVSAFPS